MVMKGWQWPRSRRQGRRCDFDKYREGHTNSVLGSGPARSGSMLTWSKTKARRARAHTRRGARFVTGETALWGRKIKELKMRDDEPVSVAPWRDGRAFGLTGRQEKPEGQGMDVDLMGLPCARGTHGRC